MTTARYNAPPPDLRIIATESAHVHERHDKQRSTPLIQKLRDAAFLINPPVVAPMDTSESYVILDGANRRHAFEVLGYPHLLVQVAPYGSHLVELGTWKHIVTNWTVDQMCQRLHQIEHLEILRGEYPDALAHLFFKDEETPVTLTTGQSSIHEKNRMLNDIVDIYHETGDLHRTTARDPNSVWSLYPRAVGLIVFPTFTPEDIMSAATQRAYLPSGITRHIIQGRALRVNYPMEWLRDASQTVEKKNAALRLWMQEKFERREVRYYSEPTYLFDE